MYIELSKLADMAWYAYLIIGFCIGVYIHCHHIRHWLHTLVIKILRGIIWLLQRGDPLYKKPENIPPPVIKSKRRDKNEVSPEDLQQWLEDNPDLSVTIGK